MRLPNYESQFQGKLLIVVMEPFFLSEVFCIEWYMNLPSNIWWRTMNYVTSLLIQHLFFQRSSFPKSSTHDDKTRGCNGMDWGKTKKGRGVHFSATESFGKNYIVPASWHIGLHWLTLIYNEIQIYFDEKDW